ncbi:MAG: RNA methyltransferase [Betaproteobacteria bacterium]|jgi:TrmH family RNA methyltransferase|nr:RNA methyltransferase [Betaproteobacteria bacterium]
MTATRFTFTHLSSRDNPRLRLIAALASMPRERRERGQTLLDGMHLLGCALDAGIALLDVCVSESGCGNPEILALLDRLPPGELPICVPDTLFARLSPVDTPTGILARIAPPLREAQEPVERETLIVLDGIQDPGNLGSILRTAAAAGIRLAWLTSGCAQAWSPKALRAGMGAHFRLCIFEQVDALAWLAAYQGKVVATGMGEASRMFFDADLRGPVAWLFGAEGQGVSPALLERADEILRIPMMEGIESLNVGAAAAVCLFEQMRQRGATP